MDMLPRLITPCLFVAALVGNPASAGPETFTYPHLDDPLNIRVPQEIRHLSHSWGTGFLRVRIDQEGAVEDWIPIEIPHFRLFDAVDRALREARFIPARESGEPVRTEVTLRIPFGDIGVYGVLTETVTEHIESRQATMNPRRDQLTLSTPGQLDEPVRLLETGPTYQVQDDSGKYLHGTVDVTFYIDHEGYPHLIRPSEESHDALREAAVLSVSGFRFTPPERNGRPTIVKARMPIVIGEADPNGV